MNILIQEEEEEVGGGRSGFVFLFQFKFYQLP